MNGYQLLEENAGENEFCRLVLDFMVNHPLDKYAKIRLLDIETALAELNAIAKEITDLCKVLKGTERQKEFEGVLAMYMVHVSCIFARNIVEILLRLSFDMEPHVEFWETQYTLHNKTNQNTLLYGRLSSIYTLSISSGRARIFKKLLSDLRVQIGHIQCWFWSLVALKNSKGQNSNTQTSIAQFIYEMRQLFDNKHADDEQHTHNHAPSEADGTLEAMIETISFADSFIVKMRTDVKKWGMPSHWRKNYRFYSFYTVSLVVVSAISYYKWPQIVAYASDSLSIVRNFFVQHLYEPLDEILRDIFYFSSSGVERRDDLQSYEIEKATLKDMIRSFEEKHLNVQNSHNSEHLNMELVMDAYKRDIENGVISSATKGSLLPNIFIQIQKMKVEISKLLIDVDNIMDSNKLNMEIFATVPFFGLCYVLQQIYFAATKSGHSSKQRASNKELRFIFRSIYSILIKDLSSAQQQYNLQNEANHDDYERCGLVLFFVYKCCLWAQTNLRNQIITTDEYTWLKQDINHFINEKYSTQQQLELLARMERYYL